MKKDVNVSLGKKMDKMVRGRDLQCVRRSRSLYGKWFVCSIFLLSKEGKNDGEAKKKQKKGLTGKRRFLKKYAEIEYFADRGKIIAPPIELLSFAFLSCPFLYLTPFTMKF
jgi:hypothetical protein